jgi:alcohol dehydrogenase class IV
MSSFLLSAVPEIRFGAGAIAALADAAVKLAGRGAAVLLVADPALAALGVTARARSALEQAGAEVTLFEALRGEPKESDIDTAAALAREARCTLVVGLGGGTALDTAKLVACCAVTSHSASAYALCATPLPAHGLPVIAIPTTAGTGSEVTRVAVFADASQSKVWAWGEELKPDLAILDPELTVAVPPAVTAATGLDALVHAIEAATNRHRHDGNDLYCLRAITLIAANLERAVKAPGDLGARGAMLLGSCLAGIGIDNCGTALAHNISHAVADLTPIPHGRATGLAMLATIDWVEAGNPVAFKRVAEAMGASDAAPAFERLVRASGLRVGFAEDGLDVTSAERLAARMALPANAPMRKSTARYPSDADLLMLARRFLELR